MTLKKALHLQKQLLALVQTRQKTSELITVKEAALKLKVSQQQVVQAAEDLCLNINIAVGNGIGYAKLPQGEHTIEDLNAPYYE